MTDQLNDWVERIKTSEAAKVLLDNRNEVGRCPLCNGNVEDRDIAIYEELIGQLYEIYKFLGKSQKHEFKMKEVRHLLDFNGYTRFADLIRCSNGILYRPTNEEGEVIHRASYGMNMERAKEFFSGRRPVHLQISLNQITGEKTVLRDAMVHQIPPLQAILTSEGVYDYTKLL